MNEQNEIISTLKQAFSTNDNEKALLLKCEAATKLDKHLEQYGIKQPTAAELIQDIFDLTSSDLVNNNPDMNIVDLQDIINQWAVSLAEILGVELAN